jgi:predicted TPR repeat methyltransferase
VSDAISRGNEHWRAGRLDEAAAVFRSVAEDDPDRYKALNNLGLVLEAQERTEDAERAFRAATELRPDAAICRFNHGRVLYMLGRLPEAASRFVEAARLDPSSADTFHNLGITLQQLESYAEAEAAYRRSIEIAPDSPIDHRCLADVLTALGRVAEAVAPARRAVELDPEEPAGHYRLGHVLTSLGRIAEAEASYRRSIELDPTGAECSYERLADLLLASRRPEEARDVIDAWVNAAPDSPVARHRRAAILGRDVPPRAGDDYVRAVFDAFADDFDATLAKLEYAAPRLVGEAIERHVGRADGSLEVLDAGCGTGLCGPILRAWARGLVGVDLSGQMLERARRRAVYDELVEAELTAYLRGAAGRFDLVASADTLNYFGALDELFEACAAALRPAGWLVFTLEQSDGDTGWEIQDHGRYRHNEPYVRRALEQCGLRVATVETAVLRREGRARVGGWVVVARRAGGTDPVQ